MKLSEILSPDELLKLQQNGWASKMVKGLIIARYYFLVKKNNHLKPTVIAEWTAKEFDMSLRNFYRILRKSKILSL